MLAGDWNLATTFRDDHMFLANLTSNRTGLSGTKAWSPEEKAL